MTFETFGDIYTTLAWVLFIGMIFAKWGDFS